MSRDGSGTYTLPAVINPVVAGATITASWANTTLDDVATEITNSVDKSGRTTLTADLPMGGFTLTGLGAGTADGESMRYEQVQRNGTASIASAATVDLDVAAGTITITGSTGPITSFGSTAETGQVKQVIFDSTPTITHNATSMILPTAANIVAVAGDTAVFVHLGSGNWKCISYNRASGSTVVAIANTFADGTVSAPGISFTSDTDTGIYRSGANTVNVAAGGTSRLQVDTGVTVQSPFTVTPAAATSPGQVAITGGATSSGSTAGGNVTVQGGQGSAGSGGNVVLKPGEASSGSYGNVELWGRGLGGQCVLRLVGLKNHLEMISQGSGDPVIASGGGTSPTIAGNDHAFKITLGSSPGTTNIVVTFGGSFSQAPVVIAQYQSDHILLRAVSTTTNVTITPASSMTAGHVIDVWVMGRAST